MPLTVLVPALMLEGGLLGIVPVTVAAVLLTVPLVIGRTRVPIGTVVPILGALSLAWLWFLVRLPAGLKEQGGGYVLVCGIVQSAFTVGLLVVWLANRNRSRFSAVVVWHFLASVWLASYAFPYFGEVL
jgi:hypothetical protein